MKTKTWNRKQQANQGRWADDADRGASSQLISLAGRGRRKQPADESGRQWARWMMMMIMLDECRGSLVPRPSKIKQEDREVRDAFLGCGTHDMGCDGMRWDVRWDVRCSAAQRSRTPGFGRPTSQPPPILLSSQPASQEASLSRPLS